MGTSKRFKPSNKCTRCGDEVINKTRLEQDAHEIECMKQRKLLE